MLDLLPDALVDHLSQWLPDSDRCRLACACRACARVHLASDWRRMRCSMKGLVRREEDGHRRDDKGSPHWTRDLAALFRLLRRPMFERLERVHLRLDARCFASSATEEGGAEGRARRPSHPFRRFAAPTLLRTVSHLHVQSILRLSSHPPSTPALAAVVRAFPSVRSVTLSNLSGVGHSLVRELFRSDSPLRRLSLRNCLFTKRARSAMASLLSHPLPVGVQGAEEAGAGDLPSWPPLESFEFTGRSAASSVRRAADALGDRPLRLPTTLEALDMGEAAGKLTEVQLLLTLAFLPLLSELVVSAKSQDALDTLDRFPPGMFRRLTVRIQV